jgi:DNA-binding CsgD family transcriptional regulator
MPARADRRLDHWLELTHELLTSPPSAFPHLCLRDELSATFDTNVAWNWVEQDFTWGLELVEQPVPGWPSPDQHALWQGQAMEQHPLTQWFLVTGSTTAMTYGRVPSSIGGPRSREVVMDALRPVGLDEQLVIPYRLAGVGIPQQSFTVCTTGSDFSDEQLTLARQIQTLLLLLARQDDVLVDHPAFADRGADAAGLTGRERAVLCLLAEGLTATAIASRLGCSPGTVRKHLEHAYAKLGVHDRLLAVRRIEELGLLNGSAAPVRR